MDQKLPVAEHTALSTENCNCEKNDSLFVEQIGQIVKRLFPYARLIAFAIEHNCAVVNPGFRRYRHLFAGTRKSLFSAYPEPFFRTPRIFPSGSRRYRRRFVIRDRNRLSQPDNFRVFEEIELLYADTVGPRSNRKGHVQSRRKRRLGWKSVSPVFGLASPNL